MSDNLPEIRYKNSSKVTKGKPANSQENYKRKSQPSLAISFDKEPLDKTPVKNTVDISDSSNFDAPNQVFLKENDSCPKESKKKDKPKIEDLEQFIAYVYSRKGKQVSLGADIEKRISKNPRLSDEAQARLKEIAKNDFILAVPSQLLIIARGIYGYAGLRNEIVRFVGSVLEFHPAFKKEELKSAIGNLHEAPSPESALSCIFEANFFDENEAFQAGILNKKDKETFVINAAYCLALWFFERRSWNIEKLNDILYNAVWKNRSPSKEDEISRLKSLISVQDFSGIHAACALFKKQAEEKNKRAIEADRARHFALSRIEKLESKIVELERQIADRDQEIEKIQDVLSQEREQHSHVRAHLLDDIEQLRTRLVRRLKSEIHLLNEGLQALRRDPPKTHVMDDHAERALVGLQQALNDLESGE